MVPDDESPSFELPPSPAWPRPSWLIRPWKASYLLRTASSKAAKLRPAINLDPLLFPTKHLDLPVDFYANPQRVRQLASLRQPRHLLPQYGCFVYKSLLRAIALQYLFSFLDAPSNSVFCDDRETFSHFLFDCPYSQEVWTPFKRVQCALDCNFPSTPLELFFDPPKPPDTYWCRGYSTVWPVIRACVLYQIWLQRVDRTFRPDQPHKAPLDTAIRAAHIINLHLQSLLQDTSIKKGFSKTFNLLRKLASDRWLHQHMIPNLITDV